MKKRSKQKHNKIIKYKKKKTLPIKKRKYVKKESKQLKNIIVLKTPNVPVKIPRKRKCKIGSPRIYFDQSTEDAIIQFNNETDLEIREQIFREKIQFPFQKLIENILNTFKFSYFETDSLNVQRECLTHLVANINKYQKDKGKAFSYFSIIAKHYFILLNNTNYKKFNQTVEISEEKDENTIQLQHTDKHYAQEELTDFIRLTIEFWENNINKIFTKSRDVNIANAVIELLRNSDRIESYNKKALYLYIREMSQCKTQQITKIINKLKKYQYQLSRNYINNGTIS